MSCFDRARRRAVIALLCGVPQLMFVSCASREDSDLFDSTAGASIGARSSGGALATGGTWSGGAGASSLTTGGIAPIPPPEAGSGGVDSGVLEPAGGESGQPSGPSPSGGATSSGGSMSSAGGASAGVPSSTGGVSGAGGSSGSGGSPGATAGSSGMPGSGTGGEANCVVSDEICDGVDNDCDDAIDEASACPNGCQGLLVLDRRYVLCEEKRRFQQARAICEGQDLRPSWVESADENHALLSALGKAMGVDPTSTPGDGEGVQIFLGGSDANDEGHWFWMANGDGLVFWEHDHDGGDPWEGEVANGMHANWGPSKPNDSEGEQNCLVMMLQNNEDGDAGQWNDVACDDQLAFLCEEF